MSNKVIKIIDWLESADRDICRLCKRVYPQHKDCISCEQHGERVAIIKTGRSLPDWPMVNAEELLMEIIDGPGSPYYYKDKLAKLKEWLRAKGVEVEEKHD